MIKSSFYRRKNHNIECLGRQRGMALFVTLIMVVVILLVMSAIAYQQQLDFKRSSQMLLADQVVLLALSGESWARKILLDDDNNNDSLEDDWAQSIPVMPVEGGWLTGCILDLNGRFNLNNLAGYTTESFDDDLDTLPSSIVDTYLNLLAILELESGDERAAVIVDWIDSNDEPVVAGGAEDSDYSIEQPPRLAANTQITDISELVTIYGYSSIDLAVMRPYISALAADTEININTASRQLMLAVMVDINDFVVDAVIENRPFESTDDFYDFASAETGYMTGAELQAQVPVDLIGVTSDYFELNARVSLVGIEMGLRSIMHRSGNDDVRVLARTFEYLPKLELEENQVDPLISPCYKYQNDAGSVI